MSESIQSLVGRLNYSWFVDKQKWFQRELSYDETLGYIHGLFCEQEASMDDNGEPIFVNREIVVNCDLPTYCWNSYFYLSIRFQELWNESIPPEQLPLDAKGVADQIVKHIAGYTEKFTDPKAIHKYIVLSISETQDAIQEFTKVSGDELYADALVKFFNETKKLISSKFSYVRSQVELLDIDDRLEFNLSQEGMVAVLYILNCAGIFNTINYNDRTFLTFCQQYFCFQKGQYYIKPKSATALSNKYGEFVNGENSALLKKIINQIQTAIKEINQ